MSPNKTAWPPLWMEVWRDVCRTYAQESLLLLVHLLPLSVSSRVERMRRRSLRHLVLESWKPSLILLAGPLYLSILRQASQQLFGRSRSREIHHSVQDTLDPEEEDLTLLIEPLQPSGLRRPSRLLSGRLTRRHITMVVHHRRSNSEPSPQLLGWADWRPTRRFLQQRPKGRRLENHHRPAFQAWGAGRE